LELYGNTVHVILKEGCSTTFALKYLLQCSRFFVTLHARCLLLPSICAECGMCFLGLNGVAKVRRLSSSHSENIYEQAMYEANGVTAKKGMVLPFQPLAIAFHHINYFIDMPPVRIPLPFDVLDNWVIS
jgi:hypothetical protein